MTNTLSIDCLTSVAFLHQSVSHKSLHLPNYLQNSKYFPKQIYEAEYSSPYKNTVTVPYKQGCPNASMRKYTESVLLKMQHPSHFSECYAEISFTDA